MSSSRSPSPAPVAVVVDSPVSEASQSSLIPSESTQPSTARKVLSWVDPQAWINSYGTSLLLNIAAPMIPEGVGDSIQWFKENYWMIHASAVSLLSGTNTRTMQARLHPGTDADVHIVMRGVNHVAGSVAAGIGGNYLLWYTMGEAAMGPTGMAALAAIEAVAGPTIGKGLDKVTEAVAPTVVSAASSAASAAKSGFFGCLHRARVAKDAIARKVGALAHRNDPERQAFVHHQ